MGGNDDNHIHDYNWVEYGVGDYAAVVSIDNAYLQEEYCLYLGLDGNWYVTVHIDRFALPAKVLNVNLVRIINVI